jgi:hypothetical protein
MDTKAEAEEGEKTDLGPRDAASPGYFRPPPPSSRMKKYHTTPAATTPPPTRRGREREGFLRLRAIGPPR